MCIAVWCLVRYTAVCYSRRTMRRVLLGAQGQQKMRSWIVRTVVAACLCGVATGTSQTTCSSSGPRLRHLWGDALAASTDCIGRDGHPYPIKAVSRLVSTNWGSSRRGRAMVQVVDPYVTRQNLLRNYRAIHSGVKLKSWRQGRAAENASESSGDSKVTNKTSLPTGGSARCRSAPGRLCRSRFNTTAPMYGVSLTSGQPVTIVQKFPDLLQQVVYEQCESEECDVMHGECVQTYIPYLFLVIPLGPVTLTGQDYVLVESGCVCRPKYAPPGEDHSLGAFDVFP